MAKRRLLKKKLSYIAGELLTASLVDGVNHEKVVESVSNVLNLIPRVSHTEPGNVKGFYKTLMTDLDKEIQAVANELNKVASAK
ncbi:MAG: hypothetical protein ACTTJK_01665 [Phocaeicola sp.]|uniref:hypothetical protein n=1 Tax=Phocaeicola sp. TaxID=2773926 RepID=UPI003F9F2E19